MASNINFSCLKTLTNLQASNCGIKSIRRHAFRGLHQLTSLDLSRNAIARWPDGMLDDAKNLVYLDLGDNHLSRLPPDFIASKMNARYILLRTCSQE